MALISTTELEEKRGIQRNINQSTPSGNTSPQFENKVPEGGYLKQGDDNLTDARNANKNITSQNFIDETYIKPNTGYSSGKTYDSAGKEVQKPTDRTNIIGYKNADNKRLTNNKGNQYGADAYNTTSSMHEFDKTRFYNTGVLMGKQALFNRGHMDKANQMNAKQMDFNVVDAEWVQSRYMVPDNEMAYIDSVNRFFSSSGWKYGSTRLGQTMAINPRPQFTRFADIKGNSRLDSIPDNAQTSAGHRVNFNSCYEDVKVGMVHPPTDKTKALGNSFGIGMGRYYSEAIDDNATTIFLEFGLPKFNSLLNYFTRAIDGEDAMVANYGYVPLGYTLGKAIGRFAIICAFPLMSLMIFVTKTFLNFLATGPFQFYYMKPAMVQYWGVVNLILNQMMTELGVFSPQLGEAMSNPETQAEKIGMPVKLDNKDIADLSTYMPGVFNPKSGYLDMYAVAQSSQMVVNRMTEYEYEYYNIIGHEVEGKKLANVKGFVIKNLTNSVKYWPGGGTMAELDRKARFSYFRKTYFQGLKEEDKDNIRVWDEEKGQYVKEAYTDGGSRRGGKEARGLYSQRGDLEKGVQADKDTEDLDADSRILSKNSAAIESNKNQDGGTNDAANSRMKDDVSNAANFKANDDGTYSYTPNKDPSVLESIKDWANNAGEFFDSAYRGGGSYAIFNVDYQGSASDSVSNSYSDVDTGGILNSVSQGSRNMKFNMAGGNVFGSMQKTITDNVMAFLQGSIEGVSWGLSNVVRTLLGGGYVDIPKKWDDSEISLHTSSYTIDLVAPYGNMISQIQNVYMPLAMLLAGALPLATGKASYTSPFLCSLFNKGVQEIKLGMITSLSIERGTSNLGFSRNKRPLGIRVSFTVSDFSNIIAAPVKAGIIDEIFDFSLEDDTPFGNYIGVLCSRDLYSSKYLAPKLKRKLSRLRMAASQSVSSAAMGMRIGHAMDSVLGFLPMERSFNISQLNDFRSFTESSMAEKVLNVFR